MTAFAALTLKNAADADVTFGPADIESGVATWLTSDDIFDAKKRVTMAVVRPKPGGSVVRVKQKVLVPLMDAVDTAKKIGEAYASVEIVMPKTMSSTARLDLRKHVETLVSNAVTTAAVTSFEGIY